MNRRNLVIAVVLASLVAAAALVLLSPGASSDDAAAPKDEESAGVSTGAAPSPKPLPAQAGPLEAGESSGGVPAPAEPRVAPSNPGAAPAAAAAGSAGSAAGAAGGSEGSGAGNSAPAESKASANKEDIRAAILELRGQIKECFEQGLKSKPDLDGTVKVEFVLARSPDGGAYAKEGEIGDSTIGAPLVEACILSKIQSAKFKDLKGDGEVRVRYPFRLSSDQAAGFGGQ
ncbi:MAG TPA: AgmX/PglI C-terminal domain-containing protein [Myxococcales bacterium]|jgi:hypothetical protein